MEDNEYWVFNTCPVCQEVYLATDESCKDAIVDGRLTQVCSVCINKFTKSGTRSGFASDKKPRLLEEEN